jgi:hypothetical protein
MRRITSAIALPVSTAPTMSHPWLPWLKARAASAPAPTTVITLYVTAQENRNQTSPPKRARTREFTTPVRVRSSVRDGADGMASDWTG